MPKALSPHLPNDDVEIRLSQRRWMDILRSLSLVSGMGFLAGTVGAMVVFAWFPSVAGYDFIPAEVQRIDKQLNKKNSPVQDPTARSAWVRSRMVSFVPTSALEKSTVNTTLRVGYGIILTADGWIALPSNILEQYSKLSVVTPTGEIVKPENPAVIDAPAGIAFLKIPVTALSVFSFAGAPDAGDKISVIDQEHFVEQTITSIHALPSVPLLHSSLDFYRRLSLGALGWRPFAGTPVVRSDGALVGITTSFDTSTSEVQFIPSTVIEKIFARFLEKRKGYRSSMGVHFLDQTEWLGGHDARGVRITGDTAKGIPAIDPSSPAAISGILSGDMITAIEQEQISAKRSLPEILLEYPPKTTVTVHLVRKGKEMTVPVTLGAYP